MWPFDAGPHAAVLQSPFSPGFGVDLSVLTCWIGAGWANRQVCFGLASPSDVPRPDARGVSIISLVVVIASASPPSPYNNVHHTTPCLFSDLVRGPWETAKGCRLTLRAVSYTRVLSRFWFWVTVNHTFSVKALAQSLSRKRPVFDVPRINEIDAENLEEARTKRQATSASPGLNPSLDPRGHTFSSLPRRVRCSKSPGQ
jgi:hypothetical protein